MLDRCGFSLKGVFMERVFITGTAGFIGYFLAKLLLDEGYTVHGYDGMTDYYDVTLKQRRTQALLQSPRFGFTEGMLEDTAKIDEVIDGFKPDVIVHLAGQAGVRYSLINPQAYIDSNIIGFTNILECCRHHEVGHLAYASSSSVYGLNEKMPLSTADNVDHPISLYAASKKSNELMAHTYSHLFGIPTTGLRFFTVYGPWGRPDMALFLFTEAMLKGEPIKVFNHGNMVRDFTYVDDIVEGVVRVIDNPPKGNPQWTGAAPLPDSSVAPWKVYNIGNNNPVKLMDFIKAIEEKLGITAEKNMMDIQPGDVPATYADVQDLMDNFNYKPETTIQEGIDAFVDWYVEYYKVEIPKI